MPEMSMATLLKRDWEEDCVAYGTNYGKTHIWIYWERSPLLDER